MKTICSVPLSANHSLIAQLDDTNTLSFALQVPTDGTVTDRPKVIPISDERASILARMSEARTR